MLAMRLGKLLKEQEEQIKSRDESLEKAREEIKWLRGMLKEKEEVVRCKDCKHSEEWYGDKRRCFLWHESGIDVFEDGFCNYGKRK